MIPVINEKYNKLLETDVRVIFQWYVFGGHCAELSVIEPTTEELSTRAVYPGRFHSASGGILSANEYRIKSAPSGTYLLKANVYCGSEEKSALKTTVYTNWGRPNQSEKTFVTSLGCDNDDDDCDIAIGSFEVGSH